ncbi:MAG TPA: hypothetical protein VK906_17570 [Egicoccus sp.]|nr:hypothetical protein [Egicoccus sp.]HSK24998.1 hypothetical protein [Egicoccus sp.]
MANLSGTPQHEASERQRLEEAAQQAEARRAALHVVVVDVTAALATRAPGSDAWFDAVRAALGRLQDGLRAHVREAELPGGLLAEIVHWQPEYEARVTAMRHEHETMLARVEELVDRSRTSLPADELQRDADELIGLIDRHRHKALELVLDAHNLDVAAGD